MGPTHCGPTRALHDISGGVVRLAPTIISGLSALHRQGNNKMGLGPTIRWDTRTTKMGMTKMTHFSSFTIGDGPYLYFSSIGLSRSGDLCGWVPLHAPYGIGYPARKVLKTKIFLKNKLNIYYLYQLLPTTLIQWWCDTSLLICFRVFILILDDG